MSPEYVKHGHFSEKSDVFSFGVIILEVISAKRNIYPLVLSSNEDHDNNDDDYLLSYVSIYLAHFSILIYEKVINSYISHKIIVDMETMEKWNTIKYIR